MKYCSLMAYFSPVSWNIELIFVHGRDIGADAYGSDLHEV
jgi:hypothetical protein